MIWRRKKIFPKSLLQIESKEFSLILLLHEVIDQEVPLEVEMRLQVQNIPQIFKVALHECTRLGENSIKGQTSESGKKMLTT